VNVQAAGSHRQGISSAIRVCSSVTVTGCADNEAFGGYLRKSLAAASLSLSRSQPNFRISSRACSSESRASERSNQHYRGRPTCAVPRRCAASLASRCLHLWTSSQSVSTRRILAIRLGDKPGQLVQIRTGNLERSVGKQTRKRAAYQALDYALANRGHGLLIMFDWMLTTDASRDRWVFLN